MSPAVARNARLLVIAVARIGDTLLATPVMRALKEASPDGCLAVLAHPRRVEALAHLPFIDRLGSIDKLRALARGWASGTEHDAAVVFGRDAALIRYALRVSHRVVAFDEAGFPADPRLMRVPPQSGTHAVLERLRLAEALGVTPHDRRLAWQVTGDERAAAKATLDRRWGAAGGPLIALQMCSFPTKAHRDWPVGRFIELGERLPEARFLVLGDDHARRAAAPFVAAHGSRTLLSAGETGLREAAALISLADLYVGVDTGPTHIAGALGVPMVALYHRDYPGRNLVPLDHPRCRMIECPMAGMDAISAEQVHGAAAQLLGAHA